MNVFQFTLDKLAGRLGYETKSTDAWDTFLNMARGRLSGGLHLTTQRQQMRAYLDWVYAAASVVAMDAATIDLHAYVNRSRTTNSKVARRLTYYPQTVKEMQTRAGSPTLEELDNHILLDLLEKPNELMGGDLFAQMTFLHLQLAGEAFWAKIRNGLSKPSELWPIMPYQMQEVLADGQLTGWVQRINGKSVPWDIEDIVHLKLPDPNNLYRGMSVVRAAARAVETDTNAADWNRAFFANSARPDLALETEQNLTQPVYERMKEQWNDEHRGTQNAHKIAILEGGLKLNTLTPTQKEMDFLASRTFNRDEILAMFGVSKAVLGLIEDANRANMEAADYNHGKRVIRPYQALYVDAINHDLAPDYDPKLVIAFTDPVPEDKEFSLKQRIQSINAYQTINEVREEMGLDSVPGGDVIYQPVNLVPLTAESEKPPEPAPVPADPNTDPNADPNQDPNNQDPQKSAHLRLRDAKKAFMTTTRNGS